MRYQITAIGQVKQKFIKKGCDFYLERLRPYSKVTITEAKASKAKQLASLQQQEGEQLLKLASGYLVALDERGKTFTSEQFAAFITNLENRSVGQLSFLVGGAAGHGEDLKRAAAMSISLSQLTLPHDLARLMLLEQLYRAETIRAGHPYHRG